MSPETAYAWIANADPVTGEPAVLGELWSGGSAGRASVSLGAVRETDPDLYSQLERIAAAAERPVRRLVRLDGGDAELAGEEELRLTVAAQLRYLHARLRSGQLSEGSYLRELPAETLAPTGSRIVDAEGLRLVAKGVPGSPGCGVGTLYPDDQGGGEGSFVIAVDRVEARHTGLLRNPRCAGVIAVRGSAADHFALLSREAGSGYLTLPGGVVDERGLRVGDAALPFGSRVTVDFTAAAIYLGAAALAPAEDDDARAEARSLLARMPRRVRVTVSVDGPTMAQEPLPPGVDGVGIVRIEYLARLAGLQDHLGTTLESGGADPAFVAALAGPLESVLGLAGGLPVAVRLLDLPVRELPGPAARAEDPALGLRGVRQAVRWPHLCQAQLHAVVEAARAVRAAGAPVGPLRVLVPMVCTAAEIRLVRTWAEAEPEEVLVGAMLETPAALVEVEEIAAECGFALFGTNDLTSLCLALGRTDYPSVLDEYLDRDLLAADPFAQLHPAVLRLVRDAATRARATRPDIELGLCGRHARDPAVIDLALAGTLDHLCVERGDVDVVTLLALQRAAG